ncbi:putative Transcriptional activator srcap [Seiridium unicorne]|uniref:Transcriptional activator srcap n=1 Tax=Seiridium unicorne TaxID=138068 RepID=A0ABR2V7L7_9PEZI
MAELIGRVEPKYDDVENAQGRIPALYCEKALGTPLVGELKASFDQLVYMWVEDEATEKLALLKPKKMAEEKPIPRITIGEFDALQHATTHPADWLFDKMDKDYGSDEVGIAAGSHFMTVAKNREGASTAVLDYVFARTPASKLPKHLSLTANEEDGEIPNKDPAKAPLKKAMGPLTIENIGLQYDIDTKRLAVVLDATFLLRPIGLALLGFSLSCKLQSAGTSAAPRLLKGSGGVEATEDAAQTANLPVSDLGVSLAGLIVSFDKKPLTIAGGFMHTTVDEADYYAGGLIFKFKPWTITAAGVYGDVPRQDAKSATHRTRISEMFDESDESTYGDTNLEISETDSAIDEYSAGDGLSDLGSSDSFTMLFIIFKLEGPLFSVGFADISGLTGGVAVNSSVRLPTAETVLSFPFVKQDGTDTKGGPVAALKSLLYPDKSQGPPWFTAREGSFWVAAGCKVTAFSMLAVDAVLVLQSNPDVQLGIYGVAIMDVPNLAATVKFAPVELGIVCTLDIGAGVFRLDAHLSPRSFILHEGCHLIGSISLYSWVGGTRVTQDDPDRPFQKDFVLTIGGYHQAFVRPPQYPDPPRLGISWAPYIAEISVTLSIMGPPMAGTIYVDFWVFGFDINFGDLDAARLPPILSLLEFRDLALKTGGSNGKGHGIPLDWVSLGPDDEDSCIGEMEGKEAKTTEPFLFNCNSGLVPNNSVPGTASASSFPEVAAWHAPLPMNTWIVRGAAFSCTITLGFAATEGALLDHRSSAFVSHKDIEITDSQKQLFAQPMQLRDPLITAVTVTITNQPVNRSWLQHNERTNEEWGHSPSIRCT